nr:BPI fold-containing family B member 2 [Podarcis muralis]
MDPNKSQVSFAHRSKGGSRSGPASVSGIYHLPKAVRLPSGCTTKQKMLKLCVLSVLLCLLVPSQGSTPGTVVRVNQEALEYVCQQGKPSLLRGLMVIQIPNFMSPRTIIGSLLKVVGIRVLNAQLPHLSVKLIPRTGVQLSLSAQLHIRGSVLIAPVELRVGSSILLDVRVMRSPHGFPILSVTACKSLLGDVDILLGGSNLLGFLKPLQNHIRAVLVDKMCLSLSSVVLGLNARLGTLVGLNSINPMSSLQYAMMEDPEITEDYIDLDLNAVIALMGKPVDFEPAGPLPPFSLPPPETVSDDSMVNMGLSEHLFASLFASLEQSGALNLQIGGQSSHLTTSMLEQAIPSISKRYPQAVALMLNVVVSKLPIISFHEGAGILRLSPAIQVGVAESGSFQQSQALFTLGVDLTLAVKLDVTITSLHLTVAVHGDVGLEVESSSMEITEISHLRRVVLSEFQDAFLAHVNAALRVGISLPKLNNVQYIEPEIEIHEGYAQVNCDLDYQP